MKLSTLTTMCARHAWRTMGVWAVGVLVAAVAIAMLLGGALTTEGNPTNNPQSERAKRALSAAFPPTVGAAVTDIVVVRSSRYTVDAPQFQSLVRTLASQVRRTNGVASVRSYPDARDPSLVSADRYATMLQFAASSDDGIDDIVDGVERADARPGFAVSVTGQKTLDRDFNELSQSDLQHGELRVGLPAALIILLLVFGPLWQGWSRC
jgi:RND superfamily putative drug exporter